MKSTYAYLRLLLCVLLLSQTGCAWWRHRHAPPEAAAPVPAPTTKSAASAAEAMPVEVAPVEVAPVAAAPTATVLSAAELQAASTLANDFYEMHMRMSARGLPGPGTMNAYAAFLCPSLATAIAEARTRQQQFVLAHPQEKPPLVDGDLFSSLFEGADRASVLEASASGPGVAVRMALGRGKGSDARRWQDTVHLDRDDGIWCVADVAYGGDWQSANRGRLADRLTAE